MDIPHVDDKVRIAPALRERAVEVTRQAAADGRIEFDELGGRVGRCLEARTQGDLRAVLGDLIPSADLDMIEPLADSVPDALSSLLTTDEVAALQSRVRRLLTTRVLPVDRTGRRVPWPMV